MKVYVVSLIEYNEEGCFNTLFSIWTTKELAEQETNTKQQEHLKIIF